MVYIKEGDGERVFLCWKFFLPIFRADRKSNYAIEALTYLAEITFLLPPRLYTRAAPMVTIHKCNRKRRW